jgi:ABC-type transporter Mla maintaining outer membrane lipid asymmetry ATPase subunit MlaF/ABC-type transporter Mla maintaining outer membrane lipid asymmetry permease subunit MlaE
MLDRLAVDAAGTTLLRDTSVAFPGGALTVIVGGSGAGKSVLLRILAGLIPPTGEGITWRGHVGHGPQQPLGRVGIVFQQFALFDELSPTANVAFAIDHRRDRRAPPAQSAAAWLRELRVPSAVPVAALSGGQKQRLAIARTLAADPEVVLYDEPTSGLDAASGRQVAALIRKTQQAHRVTSIVVTHDYQTLLPIADHVFLLDAEAQQLVRIERANWEAIPDRLQPVRRAEPAAGTLTPRTFFARLPGMANEAAARFLRTTGNAVLVTLRLPWDLLPRWPRWRWGLRFWLHYLRLVCGPSAWLYLWIAGMIVGFTTTYFTFKFLPYRLYTKPLLLEDLLASIGFALYRVLVPVLATILIAARCGAAVAADVGVKRYGSQTEALTTLGVPPRTYLLAPILLAFLVGAPLLEWLAYRAARAISLLTFTMTHPGAGPYFWQLHFDRQLVQQDAAWGVGAPWVLLKTLACGVGVAAISYYRGLRPKQSANDVSDGITATVLWATLYVLVVHFLVAFYEF